MPTVGEIKRAKEIGLKSGRGSSKVIWLRCLDCGRERWVLMKSGKPIPSVRCRHCAPHAVHFKGGYNRSDGYVQLWLSPDSFFFPMADKYGYVLRHRLIMAQHIGRCLQSWELIHHKDGIRNHDEWMNLELTTAGSHIREHNKGYRDGYQRGLLDGRNRQIQELKNLMEEQTKQIKLLQWQTNEALRTVK